MMKLHWVVIALFTATLLKRCVSQHDIFGYIIHSHSG